MRLLGFENMGFCVPNGETLNWNFSGMIIQRLVEGWSSIHFHRTTRIRQGKDDQQPYTSINLDE